VEAESITESELLRCLAAAAPGTEKPTTGPEEMDVSDYEDASVTSSAAALEPLLRSFKEVLIESGLPSKEMDELFVIAAEIYALAYRDGIRHAVGEIAPKAERHGLRLWLSPDLAEPSADPW
jgi:hypothetical protein